MSYQSKPPSTYAASKQSSKPGKSMFTRALSLLPGSSSRSKASSPASTQRAPKVTPSRPPLSYRSGATPPTGATHTICHDCPAVNSQKTTVLSRTRRSRGSFISGAADGTIVQCANCKTANSVFWVVPDRTIQQIIAYTNNPRNFQRREPPNQGPSNWWEEGVAPSQSSAPQPSYNS